MNVFKKSVFIGVVFMAGAIFSQTHQTVVLQQGVDGYNGCSWTKMLSNSSEGNGNKKYITYFTDSQLLASLYEC